MRVQCKPTLQLTTRFVISRFAGILLIMSVSTTKSAMLRASSNNSQSHSRYKVQEHPLTIFGLASFSGPRSSTSDSEAIDNLMSWKSCKIAILIGSSNKLPNMLAKFKNSNQHARSESLPLHLPVSEVPVLSLFLIPLKFAMKELKIHQMTSILMLRLRASAWISNFRRGYPSYPSPFPHYNVFEIVNIIKKGEGFLCWCPGWDASTQARRTHCFRSSEIQTENQKC